jgi:topoisomerase IA-like protein
MGSFVDEVLATNQLPPKGQPKQFIDTHGAKPEFQVPTASALCAMSLAAYGRGMVLPAAEKTPEEKLAAKEAKEKEKAQAKPKMASIPKEVDPSTVTLEMALHYLALPRILGKHPSDGVDIIANVGRFGPYVGHDRNFRSIKKPLDPYTITLEQALELLNQEKKPRGFQRKKK